MIISRLESEEHFKSKGARKDTLASYRMSICLAMCSMLHEAWPIAVPICCSFNAVTLLSKRMQTNPLFSWSAGSAL